MDVIDLLKGIPLFQNLEQDDLEKLAGICQMTSHAEGEIIFNEDDPGGSLYFVAEGSVKLIKTIATDVDKDLLTANAGMIFGEISFVDLRPRSARAVALTDANVVALENAAFTELAAASPALTKIFVILSATLADRLRLANNLMKETLIWGLEAAGGAALNLDKIITDSVNVKVDLVDGKQVDGKILKVEQSKAGYEVTLKDIEDKLFLIPYHAITRVSF
ncbi:Crp/Fnr family transcriptional regulator [Planctomycetota bacterium]